MSNIHPFQRAGLGFAPYGLARVEMGAGGQCQFCGTAIQHVFVCEDVDRREFVLGSDCIAKLGSEGATHDPALVRQAKIALKNAKEEAKNRRWNAARATLRDDPTLFAGQKPHEWSTVSMRDYLSWLLYRSQKSRQQAIVTIEREVADRTAAMAA